LKKESSSCTSNDKCSTAASIASLPYLSSLPVPYSALEASNDTSVAVLCSQMDPKGKMKWYRFTGSANCVLLSTQFTGKYPENNIAVLEGDTCGSLNCLIEPTGQYGTSNVHFTAEQDKSYWIVVGEPSFESIQNYSFLLRVRNDSIHEMYAYIQKYLTFDVLELSGSNTSRKRKMRQRISHIFASLFH
jgi:hypothetical protein